MIGFVICAPGVRRACSRSTTAGRLKSYSAGT
jgi:hypothetical protein